MIGKKRRGSPLAGIVCIICIWIVSLIYLPYDPYEMNETVRYQPPSAAHWFGTDNFGRDIFSRALLGVRYSLAFALLTLAGSFCAGMLLAFAAAAGGRLPDALIMRAVNALNSIPAVLFALVLRGVFSEGGAALVLSMSIVFMPSFVRLIRNEAVFIWNLEYVQHAKVQGAGVFRIFFMHVMPNMKRPAAALCAVVLSRAALVESALSYLGVGVQPPTPSLGLMMFESQSYLFNAPWAALLTGGTVMLVVFALNHIGESLYDKP